MKNTTFNISFDEDKASALVLYLSQKGTTVETELEKALETLYTKTVPAYILHSAAPFTMSMKTQQAPVFPACR